MGFQPASFSAYAMPADHETLLRLATRPLEGNPELLLAARGDLESRLRQSSASDSEVASAIEAFQRADHRGFLSRHWRKAVYLVALALGVFVGFQTFILKKAVSDLRALTGMSGSTTLPEFKRPAHLTKQEILILHGDKGAMYAANRWKPLWDSDPSNPVFFAQYVHGVITDTKTLPPELLEEAARVDPGNGWYPAIRAVALLDGVVFKASRSAADRKALVPQTYTVRDSEKFAEAIRLIHQAAAAERINSRQEELIQMQIPLLGEQTDWVSHIRMVAHLDDVTAPGAISLRRLADAFPAEAQRLAEVGNREEFLRLVRSWDAISRHAVNGGWTLIDMLVAKVIISAPAEAFQDAALKFGLETEAERFAALATWKRDNQKLRFEGETISSIALLSAIRGSLIVAISVPMVGRQVENPPQVTATDLLPTRLSEHALTQRIVVPLSCALIVVAIGVALIRSLGASPLSRKLSARLTDLLISRDWLLILLGGSLLPIAWYLTLVYLSPLSGREWNLDLLGPACWQLPAQALAALVLVLTLTTFLVSRALDRRLAVFGITAASGKMGWIMLVCAFLALPVIGATAPADFVLGLSRSHSFILLGFGCALAAVPLIWLLAGLVRPLFGFRDCPLRFGALIRVNVLAWLCAFIAIASTLPLHHAIECHWMKKDRLMEVSPEIPAFSRYEWEVTQQLRRELLEKF